RLAVVVHQHQLGGPGLGAYVAAQCFEMRRQAGRAVPHRHHDRQMDRGLGHADKIRVAAPAWVSLSSLQSSETTPETEPVMRARTLLLSPVLLVAVVAPISRAQTPPAAAWDSVAQILKAPASATGGYYRYGLPRRDVTLRIGDVTVSPALARLDRVLAHTATPRPVAAQPAAPPTIDTALVFRTLGHSGTARGRVAQVGFVLVPGTVTLHGRAVVPAMAYGSPVNVQMVDGSR